MRQSPSTISMRGAYYSDGDKRSKSKKDANNTGGKMTFFPVVVGEAKHHSCSSCAEEKNRS